MSKHMKTDWDIAVPLARKSGLALCSAFKMVNFARQADGHVNEYNFRRSNGLALRR